MSHPVPGASARATITQPRTRPQNEPDANGDPARNS